MSTRGSGRKDTNATPPQFQITQIVVPQSSYTTADEYALLQANVNFVNTMLNDGACVLDELPRNALLSYHVDYYMSQVLNGGLGQFVGNSGWKPHIVADCLAGLKAMGADEHFDVFRRLKGFLDINHDRARYVADGRGFGDIHPTIVEFEDEFDASGGGVAIRDANAEWLKRLPELKVVPDKSYDDAIESLKRSNPQRIVRLAARNRSNVQWNLEDNTIFCGREQRVLFAVAIPVLRDAR